MNIAHYISNWLKEALEYKERVLKDGGTTKREDVVQQYNQMCKSNGIFDSIKFAWLGEAGGKFRTSGANQFWTKVYSLVTNNDATQTTSTSQPYITGNIAPTERIGMKNPNGGNNYMTHPTIRFAANEAWSVTTVLNLNSISDDGYAGSGQTGLRFLSDSEGRYNVSSEVTTGYTFPSNTAQYRGKNTIVTIIHTVSGELNLYFNGIKINITGSLIENVAFNIIGYARGSRTHKGSISAHIIRAQALTPTQVAAEANFLRSLYPEIPSVTIGSQTWATSNCEMVATPMGNLISNVTANSNTEKITGGNFESGLIGTKTDGAGSVSTWTLNNTNPISGTQDGRLIVTNVSTSDARPYISFTGASNSGKWQKLTFNYKVNSGTCVLYGYWNGSTAIQTNETLAGTGTFTKYYYNTTGQSLLLYFNGQSLFDLQIDNISNAEVGWSDATNLYNYIYANTAGTDEQKTYAAVKAAGFWCYYNNDAAVGAIYGKLYNWYAVKLLQMDIDYYNAANPTTPWGWRVPTDTDFNTLATTLGGASVAGGKMKKDGLVYWNSPNTGADNSSGFSGLGCGYRDNTGGFSSRLNYNYFRLTNSDTYYKIEYNSSQFVSGSANNVFGFSLRLIKN